MEEKIFALLEKMYLELQEVKTEVKETKGDIKDLKQGQQRIEGKLDVITDQTAFLTEFRTEVNSKLDTIQDDFNTLEAVSGKNMYDIAILKRAK